MAVGSTLLERFYETPRPSAQTPPPATHQYSRILQDAERGIYTTPGVNSRDYLELVLPSLALMGRLAEEDPARKVARQFVARQALLDLSRAKQLPTRTTQSPLAPWFQGLLLEELAASSVRESERDLAYSAALEAFRQAYELAPDCYPAGLGLARTLATLNRPDEEREILEELDARFPLTPHGNVRLEAPLMTRFLAV
jgi:hypothetical protein